MPIGRSVRPDPDFHLLCCCFFGFLLYCSFVCHISHPDPLILCHALTRCHFFVCYKALQAVIEAVKEAPETPEGLNIRLEKEEDGKDSNSDSVLLNEAVRDAIVNARISGEQKFTSEVQTLREELFLRQHALRVVEEAALDRDALCDRVAELEISKSNLSTTTAESNAVRMGMQKKLDEMQAQLVVVMKENAYLTKTALNKEGNMLAYPPPASYEQLIRSAPTASLALPPSSSASPVIDCSSVSVANANSKIMVRSSRKGCSVSLSPPRSLCVSRHYGVMMHGKDDDVLEKKRGNVLPHSINPKVEGDDSVKLKPPPPTGQACSVSLLPPKGDVDQTRITEPEQRLEESNLAVSRLEAEVKVLATQEADGRGPKSISEWQQQPPRLSSCMKDQQHHRTAVKTDYLDPSGDGGGETEALITRLLSPPVRVAKNRSFCSDGESAVIPEGRRPLKLRSTSSSREKQHKPSKRHGRLTITLGRSTYLQEQKQNMTRPSWLRIRDEVL